MSKMGTNDQLLTSGDIDRIVRLLHLAARDLPPPLRNEIDDLAGDLCFRQGEWSAMHDRPAD
jgi:hypothetical protein